MRRLQMAGIPLPELYVCENRIEAMDMANAGLPYIVTKLPDIDIVKIVLFRVLKKRFPYIKWAKILGVKSTCRLNVIVPGHKVDETEKKHDEREEEELHDDRKRDVDDEEDIDYKDDIDDDASEKEDLLHEHSDIAESAREFHGTNKEAKTRVMKIEDFCADEASHVNIEQLQALGFLPHFMGDIVDAIKLNLMDRMQWRECWNKKLSACVGDVDYGYDAPNLMILDISGSIPEGISATMLHLIDSLRTQASAELIITGSTSMWWGSDEDLPDPKWIRGHIGYGNESTEFLRILDEHVKGRHFGNVISFGDNDCPYHCFSSDDTPENNPLPGTVVDRVMHYHTFQKNMETGYAKWVSTFCPDAEKVFDTSWCEVMFR